MPTITTRLIKIQADNINGVYLVDSFEGELISQELFYSMLSGNSENSVLCSEVDEKMLKTINDEYGVN